MLHVAQIYICIITIIIKRLHPPTNLNTLGSNLAVYSADKHMVIVSYVYMSGQRNQVTS